LTNKLPLGRADEVFPKREKFFTPPTKRVPGLSYSAIRQLAEAESWQDHGVLRKDNKYTKVNPYGLTLVYYLKENEAFEI